MNAIDWMMTHGDPMDHVIASQWHCIPETQDGDKARGELVQAWPSRFARARIEADKNTALQMIGGIL
jgi:hypothetical protein